MKKLSVRKVVAFVLILSLFSILGCSNSSGQKGDQPPDPKPTNTKDEIASILNGNKEVFKVTWSPDATLVVYIQTGKPEKNGLDEAYLWKVGEAKAKLVRDVSPTTHGFTWSPNSQYFLISEKLGDGAISSIVKAESLTEESYKIKSISTPIWSPDSMLVAYGFEHHDYGESWGSLQVYQLGQAKAEYIWQTKNYLYKAESWDTQGNIGYSEINDKGQESHKTTQNIRPSLAGLHLEDTKEQVRALWGNDYKETLLEGITVYSELVYRWDYAKGYTVVIGKDTGKVWEILATATGAETNLGAKIGDRSAQIFELYRPKYLEPVSIHGDKLYGTFKVEGAAALVFAFDLREGLTLKDIKPENKVIRMVLTYPELLDDSF